MNDLYNYWYGVERYMDDGFSGYAECKPDLTVGKIEQLIVEQNKLPFVEINTYQEPKVGEWWYVQLGPRATLVKRKVMDITPMTVLLSEETVSGNYDSRYVRDEITLIEMVK